MKYPITLANRSVKGNISITKLKEKKRKRYSKNSLIKIATKSRSEKFRKKYRWQSKNKWRRKARVKERCKRKRGERGNGLRWIMHAKNRSMAVHATLIVEMPHYAFVEREISRKYSQRCTHRERENEFFPTTCSSTITASFVHNFIINEESKNPTKKNYNSSNFSNSTFVRQRDGLGLSPFIREYFCETIRKVKVTCAH